MRVRHTLCVIGFCLLGPGCALVDSSASLLFSEAKASLEEHLECARNRHWAERAWEQTRCASKDALSEDYAHGFKDGFADYLFEGGSGEPPPLPPRRYQGLAYQTPQGYQAIQDWFAGYRHGVAVARNEGYRQWVTGSTSLPHPLMVTPNGAVVEPVPQAKQVDDQKPAIQPISFAAPSVTSPPATARAQPATDPTWFYCRTQWRRPTAEGQE